MARGTWNLRQFSQCQGTLEGTSPFRLLAGPISMSRKSTLISETVLQSESLGVFNCTSSGMATGHVHANYTLQSLSCHSLHTRIFLLRVVIEGFADNFFRWSLFPHTGSGHEIWTLFFWALRHNIGVMGQC